jgi:predicted dienelactone hydrolase
VSYDPFARGPHPVGVRTLELRDAARDDRPVPVEVWYPAAPAHAGEDVAEATRDRFDLIPGFPAVWQEAVRDATPEPGRHPAVLFSHGYGGHRRQSTFLCTHLASHGYVVAAPDHTGNTILDVMRLVLELRNGGPPPDREGPLARFITERPRDASFALDALLAGDLAARVDPARVGMAGHSFGGWTTLTTTARDRRIRAALPLAPAGGTSPLPVTRLREALDLRWGREVPTLFIVADRDTLLPLPGMRELLAATPAARKRMVVLRNADHMHFCDRVEQVHEMFRLVPQDPLFQPIQAAIPPIEALCPGAQTHEAIRGLGLAHFDAVLRDDARAAALLDGDLAAQLGARGIAVELV